MHSPCFAQAPCRGAATHFATSAKQCAISPTRQAHLTVPYSYAQRRPRSLSQSYGWLSQHAFQNLALRHSHPTLFFGGLVTVTGLTDKPYAPVAAASAMETKACAGSSAVRVIENKLVTFDDVDVAIRVEDMGGRRRRLTGGIDIECPVSRVWDVLTKYDKMHRFMPNLTQSELTKRPGGGIYLDQVGIISRKLGLKSRMLSKVTEDRDGAAITFTRVEGRDFSEFVGRYVLVPLANGNTRLDYSLDAVPMALFPVSLVERKMIKEIPRMLAAVRTEAVLGRVVRWNRASADA